MDIIVVPSRSSSEKRIGNLAAGGDMKHATLIISCFQGTVVAVC